MFSTLGRIATLSPTANQLQQLLLNACHKDKAPILKLGTLEQLKSAATISGSKIVNRCFTWDHKPLWWPEEIPERHYLVGCIDQVLFGVYSSAQKDQLQKIQGEKPIEWHVLEITEDVENELLQVVRRDDGSRITTLEAYYGKVLPQ